MPRAPDLAGRALDGRYELHVVLGEGAFGRVYRGLDRRLGRAVAVKVIKPWWAEDSAWVERFQREAQMLARVNGPGVVQIFDIGHAEEGPYYVAELVEGESLAERLRRGPLPVAKARAVAEQLCRALASAHSQGVVHCDVKPANVLLTPGGKVKVGDFGVARLTEGTSQVRSATVAGTPRYMSPEQARGRPTTPATDVYSAGVVLYEMLAGEPPFVDGSPVELGLRHLQDLPPALPGQVPQGLREVVERALAKDPSERYRDGSAMAAALHAADSPTRPGVAAPTKTVRAENGNAPGATGQAGATAALVPAEPAGTESVGTVPAGTDPASAQTLDVAAAPTRLLRGAPGAPPRSRSPARRTHAPAHRADPPTRRAEPPTRGAEPPTRGADGPPPRRRIALLGILLLLAVGALTVRLITGAVARTTVPVLRGLPRGGVEARARRLRVQPAFSTRYSDVAAGIAIAQDPSAGTHVASGSSVRVVLSAGPPPVRVPGVVGQPSGAAESQLASAGLRYGVTLIAAPGSKPDVVMRQSPGPADTIPQGSTVALSVAEAPHWRPLTTFAGVDDGQSVPFRVLGSQWKVTYSMGYTGTCLLVVVCFGPSAEARNLQTGSSFGGFDLGEGESQTHTFNSGPSLYRLVVAGGRDSARWSMTVEDYY